MEALRIEVARRRLRLKDRFQDFDTLRSGSVTMGQFRRCLAAMGVIHVLSEEDLASLENQFTSPTRGFHYSRFLADLYGEEPPAVIMSPSRGVRRDLPADEAAELDIATERFVRRIVTDGIDVTQRFKDFDKLNSGRITATQFERAFPFNVDPIIVAYLKKKYSDDQGSVSYRNWCEDVLVPLVQKIIADRQTVSEGGLRQTLSTETLLQQMRRHFALYRHRCEDAFRDFDKGRKGTVSPPQFASVMGRIQLRKMALTPEDIEGLVRRYRTADRDGNAGVDYVAFLRDVAEPFDRSAVTLRPEETIRAEAVVEKIRRAIHINRSHVKPTLHDFDRASKGIYRSRLCTRARFERSLAIHKLTLSPEEIRAVVKKYAVPQADGSPSDDIDYHAFLRDVEPDTEPTSSGLEGSGAQCARGDQGHTFEAMGTGSDKLPSIFSTKRGEPSLGSVMEKIRDAAVERSIRLKEFVADFDPLRSGIAEEQKFLSAMAMGGLALDEAELRILASEYRSDRVPGFVDVNRFLRDADTGVEIRPLPEPPFDREQTIREARRSPHRHNTAATVTREVMERIVRNIRSRGVLLPPFFEDSDRHNSGRITAAQFRQALSRNQLPLTADEATALVEHYRHPSGDVCYREFIGDVDDTENVALQQASRSALRNTFPPMNSSEVEAVDPVEVLMRLSSFVKRKAVRLSEFFQDGDPLRRGSVSRSRFRHAIDILGISLTDAELAALERAFATPDDPDRVRYTSFLAAANGTAPPAPPTNELLDTEAFLQRVVARVSKAFAARRIVSRPCFQDFDKLRKQCVTEAQFFSCLLSVGLMLHPREAAALRSRFSLGGGLMGYDAFCRAVDANI